MLKYLEVSEKNKNIILDNHIIFKRLIKEDDLFNSNETYYLKLLILLYNNNYFSILKESNFIKNSKERLNEFKTKLLTNSLKCKKFLNWFDQLGNNFTTRLKIIFYDDEKNMNEYLNKIKEIINNLKQYENTLKSVKKYYENFFESEQTKINQLNNILELFNDKSISIVYKTYEEQHEI